MAETDPSNPNQTQGNAGAAGAGGTTPPPPADAGGTAAGSPPPRPDWAPEKFWDADKGELRIQDLAKAHGELSRKLGSQKQEWEAERLARRPKTAAEYKLTLSKDAPRDLVLLDAPPGADFKAEEGKRYFQANPNDPLAQLAMKHAHAAGLDQDQFAALYTDFAQMQIGQAAAQEQAIEKMRSDARAKLGEHADARVEQVTQLVKKIAGADAVKALDIDYLPAPAIEALEKILEGKATAFPSSGSAHAGVETLTQDDIQKLMARPDYWQSGSDANRTVTNWFSWKAQQDAKNGRAA